MKLKQLEELFEKYEDEYLEWSKVENKLSKRADLHAFILLDKLQPSTMDMVCGLRHDDYFIEIDVARLCRKITEEQVLELIRCGVRYEENSLCLFV